MRADCRTSRSVRGSRAGTTLAALLLAAAAGLLSSCAATRNPWREAAAPTADLPEAIGFYSSGCLTGAVSLYADGRGYHVMRVSRRRFYGHPDLVRFVEALAAKCSKAKLGTLLIGDLAQPRGGPTMTGHISHQSGLDVDIWFWQPEDHANGRKSRLSLDERENLDGPSMLSADGGSLDLRHWSPKKLAILRLAASNPSVERVFVNPVIKREVCARAPGKPWVRKVRAWWGHDDHFHVRLACPVGNARCKAQEAVPDGDGCGPELEQDWFSPEAREAARKRLEKPEPPKMPELPEACGEVSRAPSAWDSRP